MTDKKKQEDEGGEQEQEQPQPSEATGSAAGAPVAADPGVPSPVVDTGGDATGDAEEE